jgi:lysophospholipase L1-like esterase
MPVFCRLLLVCGLCLICGMSGLTASGEESPGRDGDTRELFQDGDTIVFFGDSITQGGLYIDHVEAWLLCRYPDRKFKVLNRGISSETISGTSEADHDPRRPWAHERFTRDVTPLKPDVLIACFGMNDGNYHSFEWGRFEKYQQGVRRLIQRAREEAGVRTLILMTPPPFDPYQRKAGDPLAQEYGYKFPAIDYDQTLARYSDWLLSLREEGIPVIDLHGSLNGHLRRRRQEQVSFFLAGDAVHPNMTGHWLMALQLVRQLQLQPRPLLTVINEPIPAEGWQQNLELGGVAPIDPQADAASVDLELAPMNEFAWQALGWTQLPEGVVFDVRLDGVSIGTAAAGRANSPLTLPVTAALPLMQQRVELLKKIRERRGLEYWQYRSTTDKPLGNKPPAEDLPAKLSRLEAEIEQLRQPVKCQVELVPQPGN